MSRHTALITGAASGVGLGIAKALAAEGCQVLLSDNNFPAAQEAAQKLSHSGLAVSPVKLDVTNDADLSALKSLLKDLAQPVDILVNNAGIQYVSRLEDFPVDRWKQIIDVLLTGPALVTREVLPAMRHNGFGRVINIGSIHSLVASPYKSAYVAAKHGLLGLAKTLALETADCDITVNTICPSYVKTPLVEMQISDQARENRISEEDVINNIMLEPMPKKCFIEMDEIVATVNYLMSDSARNISGQEIVLDGGWTAR